MRKMKDVPLQDRPREKIEKKEILPETVVINEAILAELEH
jgi:hypothetical protein